MRVQIVINGQDVSDQCLLAQTRITYDSTKRLNTATVTVMGQTLSLTARWDDAQYDLSQYALDLAQLYVVQIFDGATKMFEGQIYSISLSQSDGPEFGVFYACTLNDRSAWLDRSVCWDSRFTLPLPCSDAQIINSLIGHFCPRIALTNVATIIPVVQQYDFLSKTCRQILDDVCQLSMGEWSLDMDGNLTYGPAGNAPPAPFDLSTSPDDVNSFAVKVTSYAQDFTNPINRCYVRGSLDATSGLLVEATYEDPISLAQYGPYESAIVDTNITNSWDASLRAKSSVIQYAYPVEQGNFTIWKDGLSCGQGVHIHEDSLGIDGVYVIRQLALNWQDQETVQYDAQFGAAQPDLEMLLRQLAQKTRWASSMTPPAAPSTPLPGSVTDGSIAPPGLSSGSISSVDASTIQGAIQATQIGSVSATSIIGQVSADQISSVYAGSLVGTVQAGQIGSVNASVIQGAIQSYQIGSVAAGSITGVIQAQQIQSVTAGQVTGVFTAAQIGSVDAGSITGVINAGQIGSVSAGSITGVIVGSQLADQIIDSLSKYATPISPVPVLSEVSQLYPLPNKNLPPNSFFYWVPDGNFYQMTPDGMSWFINNSPQNALMQFYNIGKMSANSIVGVIIASQIGSVSATTITGSIQASQIQSVTTAQLTGTLSADQITSVHASTITGQLNSTQIASVTAGSITGQVQANQIATVNASAIAGTVQANQIASVSAGVIQGQLTAAQIGSVNATTITGALSYNQIGSINAQSITINQLQSNQIGSVNASTLNAGTISIGGGGNMVGQLICYDGASTQMAVVGYIGSGYYGGWFKVIAIAGSGWSDAKIHSDTSGNVSIVDTNISISNPNTGTVASTGPALFDSTYSSVAWQVAGGPDASRLVSRGLVCYYNGNVVGAFVRDPGSAAGEWTLLDSSGQYACFGSGNIARVWARSGFAVGGTISAPINGITANVTNLDGSQAVFNGGILVQQNAPTIGLVGTTTNAYQVNVAVPNDPSHYYTLWFINGLLSSASFNHT